MDNELTGSNLARAMLKRGYKKIWCAVTDENDRQAVTYLNGNDFTAYIVKFENECFYCDAGMEWLYAVPIKIREITQKEVTSIKKTC